MEVSSHAIDQYRVGAVRFRTAAFTNLTRDHLDYHGTMESYGATKARLFTREDLASRVINVDDPFGRQLALDPRGRGRLIVTGRGHQSHARAAAGFVRAMHVEAVAPRHRTRVRFELGRGRITCPLVGDFNVDNLLTVLAVLLDWELSLETATPGTARGARRARPHGNPGRHGAAAAGDRRLRAHARRAAQGARRRARALRRQTRPWCSAAAAIATPASGR